MYELTLSGSTGVQVMALTTELRRREESLFERGSDLESLLSGPTVSAWHANEVVRVRQAACAAAAEESARGVLNYKCVKGLGSRGLTCIPTLMMCP